MDILQAAKSPHVTIADVILHPVVLHFDETCVNQSLELYINKHVMEMIGIKPRIGKEELMAISTQNPSALATLMKERQFVSGIREMHLVSLDNKYKINIGWYGSVVKGSDPIKTQLEEVRQHLRACGNCLKNGKKCSGAVSQEVSTCSECIIDGCQCVQLQLIYIVCDQDSKQMNKVISFTQYRGIIADPGTWSQNFFRNGFGILHCNKNLTKVSQKNHISNGTARWSLNILVAIHSSTSAFA